MYISEYYLTYKRIGVYIYLLLAFIGLITAFIKVKKIKTNWFLFSTNGAVAYSALVLLALFNWDSVITSFNINRARERGRVVDKLYLTGLGGTNLPELLQLKASSKHYDYSFAYLTDYKLYHFMEESRSRGLPSFCFDTYSTRRALLDQDLVKTVTDLSLSHAQISDLSDLNPFRNLSRLDLRDNSIRQTQQLLAFPHLKTLDLRENEIYVLKGMQQLQELEELDISKNPVVDYSPLISLKKLKKLSVDSNIKTWELNRLLAELPNTLILKK